MRAVLGVSFLLFVRLLLAVCGNWTRSLGYGLCGFEFGCDFWNEHRRMMPTDAD